MYGPTVRRPHTAGGHRSLDRGREDRTVYGEEVKFGGGKVIRDGMGQSQRYGPEVVDIVITNALILDHWGIVKADIASAAAASPASARPAIPTSNPV